jgi:hypothetical protein
VLSFGDRGRVPPSGDGERVPPLSVAITCFICCAYTARTAAELLRGIPARCLGELRFTAPTALTARPARLSAELELRSCSSDCTSLTVRPFQRSESARSRGEGGGAEAEEAEGRGLASRLSALRSIELPWSGIMVASGDGQRFWPALPVRQSSRSIFDSVGFVILRVDVLKVTLREHMGQGLQLS